LHEFAINYESVHWQDGIEGRMMPKHRHRFH
jgi:hypothetical protein